MRPPLPPGASGLKPIRPPKRNPNVYVPPGGAAAGLIADPSKPAGVRAQYIGQRPKPLPRLGAIKQQLGRGG